MPHVTVSCVKTFTMSTALVVLKLSIDQSSVSCDKYIDIVRSTLYCI